MNEKIFETEIAVGPDHKLILELPEATSNQVVKVTVEVQKRTKGSGKKRTLSMKHQGAFTVPDNFFAPLSEEEMKDWEGGSL